jgi:energy-coupling factor transporter ATP-binding protein EcfA2
MRINSLYVENFKAIKRVDLENIPSMIVVAGPNGSGKSTLFDAIRLVKSFYGGYQPNEVSQWFSEFQININPTRTEMTSLFYDRKRPIKIRVEVGLTAELVAYIGENLDSLLRSVIAPQYEINQRYALSRGMPIATRVDSYAGEIDARVSGGIKVVYEDLKKEKYFGEVTIHPGSNPKIVTSPSPLLELVFSAFDPHNLGIIDYHGSQRFYQREMVGGINLDIATTEQQASQHALYNYANKYVNIKQEMAGQLVRELISERAGIKPEKSSSLTATLQELFETFFPGKHFPGPVATATGVLKFPVTTDDGVEHDVNDLSSGEKEVLYGYLRLRNLNPQHSVVLIDEPELHLNPRLIQGLPQFYQKYLGKPLGNQIWLLTHSDGLLREALLTEDAVVYHMLIPDTIGVADNQIKSLAAEKEIEKAVIDLVGDLAAYKPGAKVVLFEGSSPSEFDIHMVAELFPDFAKKVNLISGGNKTGVKQLHAVLEQAHEHGALPMQVYSVVDRDFDEIKIQDGAQIVMWDVYHIENYLMDPKYILNVGKDVLGHEFKLKDLRDITGALLECAKTVLNRLVIQKVVDQVNSELFSTIQTKFDPASADMIGELRKSVARSRERFDSIATELDDPARLEAKESSIRMALESDLKSGKWISTFPGRDILRYFCNIHLPSVKTEYFMNLIIAKMRDEKHQPAGMKKILETIA